MVYMVLLLVAFPNSRQIVSPLFLSLSLSSSGCVSERIRDEWRLPTFIYVSLVPPSFPASVTPSPRVSRSPMLIFLVTKSIRSSTLGHIVRIPLREKNYN